MPAVELGAAAREIYGDHRVTVASSLADAIDQATALVEAGGATTASIGSGAVLVTGSVVTVGEARAMLKGRG
jgi:dihydrofolate synthase/folylpolyglutamate synthase